MLKSIRSQLELMGLVFIVLLLTIAMLFYLQCSLRPQRDRGSVFLRSQIARNTLTPILESHVPCPTLESPVEITSVIQNCLSSRDLRCKISLESDEVMDSCETFKLYSANILNQTLKEWGKNYELRVSLAGDEFMNVTHGRCVGEREAYEHPFKQKGVGGEQIIVSLFVCERRY